MGTGGAGTDVKGPTITITEFAIPSASNPGWIAGGPDGKIWFTHESTAPSAVGNLTTMGTMFTLFPTASTRTGPTGITGGPDGNVWFAKQYGIGRVTASGTVSEYVVPNGGDSGDIVIGPDGNLWFTQPLHDRIGRVTPAAAFSQYDIGTAGANPLAITLGPDGNLWFTEAAAVSNKIAFITPNGMVTEFPIPTPSSNPTGIAKGADGNLWFTEHDGHKIGRITPAGAITEFPIASGGNPVRIAVASDGTLWFTEPGVTNSIGRITSLGGISEYPVPTTNSDPTGITAGPDKNVWFSELSSNKIGRISDLAGGGSLNSSDGSGGSTLSGGMLCMKDTDCNASGRACGGDVCSWISTTHTCVLAETSDPGWCTADTDCWCMSMGATCDKTKHHCSFTQFAAK
jgi:virginiamycin B lyase